jgi:hypothetical protein
MFTARLRDPVEYSFGLSSFSGQDSASASQVRSIQNWEPRFSLACWRPESELSSDLCDDLEPLKPSCQSDEQTKNGTKQEENVTGNGFGIQH